MLTLMLLPLSAMAQVKFGYLSYRTICQEMPQYVSAQKELHDLKDIYEQEARRGEEEFQRKFADFLHGQKEFPENILQKRQAELQDLMDRGVKFRSEAEQLLREAEQKMLQDLGKQLNEAIVAVGMETGYSFILNIDDNACPFINPILGDDVSNLVRQKLGIPVIETERPTPIESDPLPEEAKEQPMVPEDAPARVEPIDPISPVRPIEPIEPNS